MDHLLQACERLQYYVGVGARRHRSIDQFIYKRLSTDARTSEKSIGNTNFTGTAMQ